MKETDQLRKLMESVYTPLAEDDTAAQIEAEFAKVIEMAKAHFEGLYYEEDEVLEMVDDMYKGGLSKVYGSEF